MKTKEKLKNFRKKLDQWTWPFIKYALIALILCGIVLVVLLGFDYVYNLKIDMFSGESSASRVVFYIWLVIFNFAYAKSEWPDLMKKLF